MKILLLAGGTGKRLWPVSRSKNPKQFKKIFKNKSLIKVSYQRNKKVFGAKDIILSLNQNQIAQAKKDLGQIAQKNIIAEPVKRGTAPAIGLACALLSKNNPEQIIATVNSDHFIKNEKEYVRILKQAEQAVKKYPDKILLVGLKPTYPETGYGYIKLGKAISKLGKDKIFNVSCFKEKPNLVSAKKYFKSQNYLWNPAYFVFRVDTMLKLFKKYLPAHYRILKSIQGNPAKLKTQFSKMKKISIDYGIMEKAKNLICLPADFDWADIGSWKTVQEILAKGEAKNVVRGKYVSVDGNNNLVYSYSDKLVATAGIKNSIIIETKDVLLVCSKDQAQNVKELVKEIKRKKLTKYL